PLGVEPVNGRDILTRIYAGSWISLLIAVSATLLSVTIGTVMGVVAGFFGGWVDTIISRAMDVFLAFPILVFAIALAGVVPDQAFGLQGDGLRIVLLIFVIGFFNWPYIGRIVRGQTLSLREREFVDAARSLGGRGPYILFRELLPNLVAPILVYSTMLIPTNILFEAALSFLGVGIRPPTATWGGMLSDAVRFYTLPHFMLWPGLAIFITVLAFNLFGDGLRDALDPRSR
ncbi:ABC transporter permease, partial [Actinophytocola sp.]|uniref:ABC transporter permease n=1 Tax=Actinophytocola sp. TaxID=1872138 RepID=UPI002ED9D345